MSEREFPVGRISGMKLGVGKNSTVVNPPERVITGVGQVIAIHPQRSCAGEHCAFHRPSEHKMNHWPIRLCDDLPYPLLERICEHGQGHPDPDSVAFLELGGWFEVGDHECDGCCRSE